MGESSEPDLASISGRIAYARKAAGIATQAGLAERIGLTRGAVSHWEAGNVSHLKPDNLVSLSDATGYSIRWLAIGAGPRKVGPKDTVPPQVVPPRVLDLAERLAELTEQQLSEMRRIIFGLADYNARTQPVGKKGGAKASG